MRILKLWKDLLKKPCPWMIRYLDRHGADHLVGYISDRANTVGLVIAMHVLDREGISHCKVCPSRFEIHKKPDGYYCGRHFQDQDSQPRIPLPLSPNPK